MKTNAKKWMSGLLALLMMASSASCVEYKGIQNNSSAPVSSSDGALDDVDDGYFSVKLAFRGEPFTQTSGIQAQWTDGTSIFRAPFENGVAKIAGLDGDYHVTIHGLPISLLYDPNSHMATNDDQDITVDLYVLTKTQGEGTDPLIDCIRISEPGAYAVTLKERAKAVYYEFLPRTSGTFTIETIMDVNENKVNPRFEVFNGTFAAKYFARYIDDGGASGVFTRNPSYKMQITESMVGNVSTFGIQAEHRDGVYPVTVYFLIKYEGEYNPPAIDKSIIIPDQGMLALHGMIDDEFLKEGKGEIGTLTYPEVHISEGAKDRRFDGSMFKLNEADGFYHVYDETTGEYGPILYAQISQPHRFFSANGGSPVSFTNVESVSGTAVLLLSSGQENYKLFIEGGAAVVAQGVVGMEDCGMYYGLADYISNSYGLYPVTEEVQQFLQKFAQKELYFRDGQGWAETTAESVLKYRIYSTEEDQWLFACCYFQ